MITSMSARRSVSGYGISIMLMIAFAAHSALAERVAVKLEWRDLVPPGWQPPIIAPAPDEHHHLDPRALVQGLHHQYAQIPGYMLPVKFSENRVEEFLLMPFLEHHTRQHIHHESNQLVYVRLQEPLAVNNPYEPFWVTGTLLLEPVETDEGVAGYTLKGARAWVYHY